MTLLLAGDVGGTKTNLGIFSSDDSKKPVAEGTFPSSRYPGLATLVKEFLNQVNVQIDHASFGVAGPVVEGQASITNLPWVIDEKQLVEELKIISVHLLNDLEAIAFCAPSLGSSDLHTLNVGKQNPGGTIAVVAPGTGLGEAFVTWDGSLHHAYASEGGHADFAPTNQFEIELLRYLRNRFDHVSFERVCSGKGLRNIHSYLEDSGFPECAEWHTKELATGDPIALIVNAALNEEENCAICKATLDAFVSILGAEASNLALKVMATKGVYLGGGIPPRILPALNNGRFMQAFQRKGRMSQLTASIPVHVILNPKVALLGAAHYGLERIGRSDEREGKRS
ncbi:MAG: glucokinase [Candidatus Bathyarchaeia archaeon]